MNLKDKIIFAHKGFFDRESEKIYRENSIEVCKIANTKQYIQAIELDLRKSKEGIVYCYHGNLFFYYTILKFPLNFSFLQNKFHVDTFADILKVISEDKVLILDIKDHTIIREDIIRAMDGKSFREVILANRSVSYLKRFADMPNEFVKLLNGNVFSTFYNLKKLKEDNFKYFEITFPFLATKKMIKALDQQGLLFVGFPAVCFLSLEAYTKTVDAYNIKYVPNTLV